jgi:outer membrane immunogenic protein
VAKLHTGERGFFMRTRLCAAATAWLAVTGSALAADLGFPAKAGAPGAMWSGCHLGIQGGVGAAHNTWTDQPANLPFGTGFIDANGFGETANTDMTGGLAGGQLGCDYQFGSLFVVGVQGSMAAGDITGTNFDQFNDTWSLRSHIDWMATGTARLGFAVNNVLIYGRGGGAWAHDRFEIENAETNLGTPQATRFGWTAGAGIEWAFAHSWSAFMEMNYYSFAGTNVSFPGNAFNGSGGATAPFTVNTALSIETFTLGVNYRF